MRRQVLAALIVAATGLLSAAPVRAETCYADWSEAGPIVKSEGLATAKDVQERARGQVEGKLIKITLCEDGGSYTYRLVFDQPDGKVVDMVVDARAPFQQP